MTGLDISTLVASLAVLAAGCAHAPRAAPAEDWPGKAAIERGGLPVERGSAEDPIVEIARGAEDGGTHRAWLFAERPQGVGDLVVRIGALPRVCVGGDSGGAILEDPVTGARSRFDDLVWGDARGAAVLVRSRCAGSIVLLVVSGAVVDGSSYPSRLGPPGAPTIEVMRPTARRGAPRTAALPNPTYD